MPTDVEGRRRPQRSTDLLSVVVATSRSPANALMSRSVDDDGGIYIMDRRPAESAAELAAYRHDVIELNGALQAVEKMVNDGARRWSAFMGCWKVRAAT